MAVQTFTFRVQVDNEDAWERIEEWSDGNNISKGHLINAILEPLAYAIENETYKDKTTKELVVVMDFGAVQVRPAQH